MTQFFYKMIFIAIVASCKVVHASNGGYFVCESNTKSSSVAFTFLVTNTTEYKSAPYGQAITDVNEDVKEFSFRDGNLLLTTFDKLDDSRLRKFISAQFNSVSRRYEGQFYLDQGGTEIQIVSGPVKCTYSRDIKNDFL
ncbi:MAG: hypothetical protein ACXVCY_03720 [Pseudobdellovibrionaceae bacterium]